MKFCECCGGVSFLLRQEQRGTTAVDVFRCSRCGEWEDYRIAPAPHLTLDILAERHERYKAAERIRGRKRRRKAQGLL